MSSIRTGSLQRSRNYLLATILCATTLSALLGVRRQCNADEDESPATLKENQTQVPAENGKSQPQLPGAITEPPVWVGENLPFDKREYFLTPPPEQNAAPLYLDALFEFSADLKICFAEPERSQRSAVAMARKKRLFQTYFEEDFSYKDLSSIPRGQLDDLLKEYELGLEKLRRAQERPQCVFEIDIDPMVNLQHAHATRDVAYVLDLQTYRDLQDARFERAIDNVEILLRLTRDLVPRGDSVCQFTRIAVEASCVDRLINRILAADGLESKHCDRLLTLLATHEASLRINPVLAVEQYYHLVWRKLLYQLEHKQMAEIARELGMDDPGSQTPINVLSELFIAIDYEYKFLPPSDMQVILEKKLPQLSVEKLFRFQKVSQQLRKVPDNDAEQIVRRKTIVREFLGLFADDMTASDYAQEIEALNANYRQMAEVCQTPFPQKSDRLKVFAKQLMEDENWQNTKILWLFRFSHDQLVNSERRNELRRNAALCLIALKRWQLVSPKAVADDMASIVNASGLSTVPIDPFSGQPLKMTIVDGHAVVYSVGPDGDDDLASRVVTWEQLSEDNPPDGDMVFTLKAER